MEFGAAARDLEPVLEQSPECSEYNVHPSHPYVGCLRCSQHMLSSLQNTNTQSRALGR